MKSKRKVIIALVAVIVGSLLIGGFYLQKKEKEATTERKGELYICPMHPDYVSDRPGNCPICGMKLIPASEKKKPMEHMKMGTIYISPQRQQLIGVKTKRVEKEEVEKTIRTVGRIEYDETKLAYVNLKYSGWIEELYADYVGKFVKKGEILMTVYSPDLIQAQEEYLQTIKNSDDYLKEKAFNKLILWGIDESEIKEIEKDGILLRFPIRSPISGFIIEKKALKGKFFKSGENLFKIADLRKVWVIADIYEYELELVEEGAVAEIELPYLPGKVFKGRVTYIYPDIDPLTRTAKIRIELSNPDYELKPGMYATVILRTKIGERLIIPKDAVLDSGKKKYVFIRKEGGYFEPRIIKLGAELDDYYIVEDGLEEGEEVVTSSNFLIDSESKLKLAISGMKGQSE